MPFEEATHRGVLGERFQELDLAAGEREQRDLHALALDLLDALYLEPQHLFVEDPGVDDRAHGDPDVSEPNGHRGSLREERKGIETGPDAG